MLLGTIILIAFFPLSVRVIPAWPHSRSWGFRPTSEVDSAAAALPVQLLTGRF